MKYYAVLITVLAVVLTGDLSGASLAVVSYWRWYSNDQGNAPSSDYWVVQVNTGSGWTNLENTLSSSNAWVTRGRLWVRGLTGGGVIFVWRTAGMSMEPVTGAGILRTHLLAVTRS